MKIAVIGAGNVGTALAKRLKPHGQELMLSYSREPEKLRLAAEAFGVLNATPSQAAA
jgi:predicted dinucleotide-binding enzyme